jgi:hypothetical protein
MTSYSTKKSALDDALDLVRSGVSNFASGFQKAAAPISQTATSLYNNFSQGLQNYGNQQNALARQRDQQAVNFASNIINGVKGVVQNPQQAATNFGKGLAQGQLNAEKNIPIYGQLERGIRNAVAPIMGNFNPELASKFKALSQPEGTGFGAGVSRFVGEQVPYIPLAMGLGAIVNPWTAKLAGAVPAGVGVVGKVLAGAAKGAIELAPYGILAGIPVASPAQRAENVARGVGTMAGMGAGMGAAGSVIQAVGSKLVSTFGKDANTFMANRDLIFKVLSNNGTPEEIAQVKILNQKGMTASVARSAGDVTVTELTPKQGKIWDILRSIFPESFEANGAPKPDLAQKFKALNEGLNQDEQALMSRPAAPESPISTQALRVPNITDLASVGQESPNFGVPAIAPQFRTPTTLYDVPMHPDDLAIAEDAIKYLDSATSIEDFMSPRYQKSEDTIRALASNYIDKRLGSAGKINNVIQELKNRMAIDIQDQPMPGLENNIGKNLDTTSQNPAAQAILKDMNIQLGQGTETPMNANVGQTAIAQPAYDTSPAANAAFDMPSETASGVLKSLLSNQELEVLNPKGIIVAPDGSIAHGKYFDSVIAVVEQGGKVESQTVYHEAFHALVDKIADPTLYKAAIEAVKTDVKMSDATAIEKLAEDFPQFISGKQTFSGPEADLFSNLTTEVHKIRGAEDSAAMMNMSQRGVQPQPMQVGITSAQNASQTTAPIIAEGNALFEAGKIDEGLAKLQEATAATKDQLTSLLSDGVTKINRLETNTHGLYFGTPEPSYWLNVTSNNSEKTIADIAQFAKDHNQESFIAANHSFAGDTLGVTFTFKPNLTNQEVLAIEKTANEAGIGLTLNQSTGEAFSYNIKAFDSMEQEDWLKAALQAVDTLKQSGLATDAKFDNYDLKVYTNDTYDQLISRGATQNGIQGQSATQGQGATSGTSLNGTGNAGDILPKESNQTSDAQFRIVKSSQNPTNEDAQLALENLRKYRGDVLEAPPKQIGTELSRSATTQVNRLNKMKTEFQTELDNAQATYKNYDLIAKADPRMASKGTVKETIIELKRSIAAIDKHVMEVSRDTVPVYEQPAPTPSDQELAMKQLNEYRSKTSLVPQGPIPVPEPAPTPAAINPQAPTVSPQVSAPSTGTTVAPTQPPPMEKPVAGQAERGLVTSIRSNPEINPDVRAGVSGVYDMTSDAGRIEYGKEAVKKDYAGSMQQVLSDEVPLSNEIQGIGLELFQDLQRRAAEAKAAGRLADYESIKNQAIEVGNAMARKATPAAQALQFYHLWSYSTPDSLVGWARDIYDQANEMQNLSIGRAAQRLTGNKNWKLSLSEDMVARIKQRMGDISLIPDENLRAKETHDLMQEILKPIPTPARTIIDAYRYQNALSGIRTHLRNITNNAFNATIVKPLQVLDMATWDAVKSGLTGKEKTRFFKEVPIYYRSLFGSMQEGTQAFLKTVSNPNAAMGKSDVSGDFATFNQGMAERVPGYLTVAGRALEGADQFFVTLIRNAEYARLQSLGMPEAQALAKAKILASDLLYKSPTDTTGKSGQGKLLQTMDRLTEWVLKGRTAFPPIGWFAMFVRVPMAVAKMGMEYNPIVGPFTAIGAADPGEQYSKARVGAAVVGFGAMMALAGHTTWAAPTDPEEKTKFYDTGRKPFSFQIDTPFGQQWVPFAYLGPWALPFGMAAAYKHYFADSKTALTDSVGQKVFSLMMSSLNQWSQSTPLSGLGGFVQTFEGNVDYSTASNLAFTAGQLMPLNSLMGDITHVVDPTFRKASGFIAGLTKNIPWASKNLPAITDSYGQEAKRNITDYIFPWSLGQANPAMEQPYKDVLQENQLTSQANYFKNAAQKELDAIMGGAKVATGSTKTQMNAALDVQKKQVDTLLTAYDTATTQETRDKIQGAIEKYGINFDSAYENFLTKDMAIPQKGLSADAQGMLARSKEFTYVRALRNKFDGTGLGGDALQTAMDKHSITEEALLYDDKTSLPDDVQLSEIQTEINGLKGEDLLASLVSMRRVSEGTRKPLLTDTLIGKLVDEQYLSKDQGAYLKRVGWDSKTGGYKMLPAGAASKAQFDYTSAKSPSYKVASRKLGTNFGLGSKLLPARRTAASSIRTKRPTAPSMLSMPKSGITTPKLRTSIKALSGLGRP